MRRTQFALAVLLALLVPLAAGCGMGTPAGNPSSSASGAVQFSAYENADYPFSIAYPAGWTKTIVTAASTSPKTGDRLLAATFLDPKGAVAKSGMPVDGVTVEVFQLDKAVTLGKRYTNTALRIMGGSLLPRLKRIQLAGKPKDVTVHVPGMECYAQVLSAGPHDAGAVGARAQAQLCLLSDRSRHGGDLVGAVAEAANLPRHVPGALT
ncbi:MAG: hypothetical protein WCP21_15530 [Armatimonadota bacterium]